MSWIYAAETDAAACVHVACVDWRGEQGPCQYAPQPPAIGPELPEVIRDAEGGYWRAGGAERVLLHGDSRCTR